MNLSHVELSTFFLMSPLITAALAILHQKIPQVPAGRWSHSGGHLPARHQHPGHQRGEEGDHNHLQHAT